MRAEWLSEVLNKLSGSHTQIPTVLSKKALPPGLTLRSSETDGKLSSWPGQATMALALLWFSLQPGSPCQA